MGGMTPKTHVDRTLDRLRAAKYSAAAIGTWFGLPDVVLAVLGSAKDFLLVASCGPERAAMLLAKAMRTPPLKDWLQAGGRFEVWSWSYTGHSGGGKSWQAVKRLIGLHDVARLERGGL
jgi:hypothetical protein